MTIKDSRDARRKGEDRPRRLSVASPPGYLFRLVDRQQSRWYFYNDTKDYVMVVNGYFGARNTMRALQPARMWRELPSGLLLMEVVVEPLQTAGFLEGDINDGFDLRFRAVPVKEAGTLIA
ncbi:calpain-like cysteine peptidase [Strigomonas culicis]|uniref:Calpain-like cysteine peptidase n=1 Tax=Strigomonas culicis TaxID=28005 RepID=S9W3A7_9TRYP|nr:calpain-like cysteine peptidase [Strigomonas culicis]|eukprot:EPY33831.1 calpain-like cysteine peptidase [Strigomonas culicis]